MIRLDSLSLELRRERQGQGGSEVEGEELGTTGRRGRVGELGLLPGATARAGVQGNLATLSPRSIIFNLRMSTGESETQLLFTFLLKRLGQMVHPFWQENLKAEHLGDFFC